MRDYVARLRQAGELAIVEREVSGRFELAAVAKAVQRTSERP